MRCRGKGTGGLRLFLLLCVVSGLFVPPCAAQGLAGEMGGLRPRMQAHGLSLNAAYDGEFVRNLDPGLLSPRKDTIYEDDLDLEAELDTGAAGLWPDGTFYVHGLFNHGGQPTATVIGNLQTVSNIEATRNRFSVYEAWYQQAFPAASLSLLAGLHNMNADFYASRLDILFLNASFGIGPEVSENVPTSIFPRAGLGMRLRYGEEQGWYAEAGAYDGDPATRQLSAKEGAMLIAETGLHGAHGSVSGGAWLHTAHKSYAGQGFGNDFGGYALGEGRLLRFAGGAELGGFVQLGWVPARRNAITGYLGAGLHLAGLPWRPDDEFGLATANARSHTGTEHVVELTWRAVLRAGLAVQPSMQWIINPGGDPAAATIRVLLLRFTAWL